MKRLRLAALAAGLSVAVASPAFAQAQDQFLGQMMVVGFSFCPKGWTDASGQTLSIAQNQALFALFGTTYGGNGVSTFALPNMNARVMIGQGTGPGLPTVDQGTPLGTPTTTLTVAQMPAHMHLMMASSTETSTNTPSGNILGAVPSAFPVNFYSTGNASTVMNNGVIGNTGGNQPFSQYQPSTVLRYCVALTGVFPSRN